MKNIIYVLFLIVLFTGCLKDDPLNRSFETFAPKDIGDGLVLSYPSAEMMDSLVLFDIRYILFIEV